MLTITRTGSRRKEARFRSQTQDTELHYQLEMERTKVLKEDKIAIGKLRVEKVKLEAGQKIVTIKEKEKRKNTVKLSKIKLRKFDGNVIKWTEFWELFESTIHNNENLQVLHYF